MGFSQSWHVRNKRFANGLFTGIAHQEYIAKQLEKAGIPTESSVYTHPDQSLDTFDKVMAASEAYSDDVDLLCFGWIIVEVKARLVDFTSTDDYPYPEVFTETVGSRNKRKLTQPHMYMNMSKQTQAVIGALGSTFDQWTERTVYDRNKGFSDTWYQCPLELYGNLDWCIEQIKKLNKER